MPTHQVDIQKVLGSEYWTNRYLLDMDSFSAAIDLQSAIITAEVALHSTLVQFDKARVSNLATEEFLVTPLGITGTRSPTDLLPLFNTLRYDFTAATGRPSRKYYRGVLGEGDINGSAVTSTFTTFEGLIEALFKENAESQGIVDPQDTLLTSAVRFPFVQMRQLRRGTRRRGTPIFQ